MKIELYTWKQFDEDIKKLADKVRFLPHIKNIYGVPREGLILAVVLSHELNLPLIPQRQKISRETLIVDDISETGTTLRKLLGSPSAYTIGTLFSMPGTTTLPDYFIKEKKPNTWIVFPWENKERAELDAKQYYANKKRN